MRARLSGLLCLLSLFIAGCGTPGAPRPPSLDLPKPVDDLRAVRVGDKVYLQWTVPTQTNENETVRHLGTTRVCRAYRSATTSSCANQVTVLDPSAAQNGKMTAVDDLSSSLSNATTDFLNYNVEVQNSKGRSAGPSNAATVFLARGLPAPADVRATVRANGVLLQWTNATPPSDRLKTEHFIRVERAATEGNNNKVLKSDLPFAPGAMDYSDSSIEWEKTYEYRIVGVTRVLSLDGKQLAEFEGEPSAPIRVTAHDTFPPKAPAGVQAVFSGVANQPSIDLTWTPNDESDLAGYNVYRAEAPQNDSANAPASPAKTLKLTAEPVKTPSFRDTRVSAGRAYVYFVTAVDARGNESPHSDAAKESVPQSQ